MNMAKSSDLGNENSLDAEIEGRARDNEESVKIICLGDSAVGKSKYVLVDFVRFRYEIGSLYSDLCLNQ